MKNVKCDFLNLEGIPYEVIHLHGEVHTVEQTAAAVRCEARQVLKALVLQDELVRRRFAVFVLIGTKRLDLLKARCVSGFGEARLASPSAIVSKTGFEVGTLPAWGYSEDVPVYYDSEVLKEVAVFAGSGSREALVRFDPSWLARLGKRMF